MMFECAPKATGPTFESNDYSSTLIPNLQTTADVNPTSKQYNIRLFGLFLADSNYG